MKQQKQMYHLALVVGVLLGTHNAFAAESKDQNGNGARLQDYQGGFFYGFGLGVSQSIYYGEKREIVPLPLIGYYGADLTVLGPFISYKIYKNEIFSFHALTQPRFNEYDSSDSDIFRGMEDRDETLEAGFGISIDLGDWDFGVNAQHDVLGKHKGYELSASVDYELMFGKVSMTSSLGVKYLSEKFVDYYYGVEKKEAMIDRPFYEGEEAINPGVGISFEMQALGGFAKFGLDYTWYDDAITDSPLVEHSSALGAHLVYTRFF
ncbi:MipA/OmpV family protein [Algicola sagamiensis]|uniref:MipA/OmpV family protein n=1 Tax=Algicola sagamiensis TaxID=163869 RepID=UPI00037A0782|nr:MipA/OmpV family protein [Algicola sagamiensis]